jgi:hypothetical protein
VAEDLRTREQPRLNVSEREVAPSRRRVVLRGLIAAALVIAALGAGLVFFRKSEPPLPREIRGSPAWARFHYGNPDARGFRARNIVEIDFLGTAMFVHRKVQRHFLRLESLFEARAPEYAAAVAAGVPDDWSYINRDIRGGAVKSNHAFGIAIDVNALANVVGTSGDMPMEVVRQWETEGGAWGGDWSPSDPMHFESNLTPQEIRERYAPDGTPKDWYLEELVGG